MATTVLALLLVFFGSLLWLGAAQDLRQRRISNDLSIIGMVLWPLAYGLDQERAPLWLAVGAPMAIFAVGFALWSRGILGGADVKIAAVTALWATPEHIPLFLLVTAIAGGILAIITIKLRDFEPWLVDMGGSFARWSYDSLLGSSAKDAVELPYGIAIAIGGTLVLLNRLASLNLEIL